MQNSKIAYLRTTLLHTINFMDIFFCKLKFLTFFLEHLLLIVQYSPVGLLFDTDFTCGSFNDSVHCMDITWTYGQLDTIHTHPTFLHS